MINNLGYFDGWYICSNHKAMIHTFNGRFESASETLQTISREAGYQGSSDEAKYAEACESFNSNL